MFSCASTCLQLYPASLRSKAAYEHFVDCCSRGTSAVLGSVSIDTDVSLPPRNASAPGLPGKPVSIPTSLTVEDVEKSQAGIVNILSALLESATFGLQGSPVLLQGSATISLAHSGHIQGTGNDLSAGSVHASEPSRPLELQLQILQATIALFAGFSVMGGAIEPVSPTVAT